VAEKSKVVYIADQEHGLPFSKGLLAASFTATGLPPSRAYEIAAAVQDDLRARDETTITSARLRELAAAFLGERAGESFAGRYRQMRELTKLEMPLVVLIGGTTGVGKSTIATEVAHRLGITRISSTDAIREVMRGIFTQDLMPAIHESAFNAWRGLRVPVPEGADPIIVGFREQTAVVSNGVQSLVDRAVLEGYSMVMEGVHLVPGYLDLHQFENARVLEIIIGVEDESAHLSHFYIRDVQTDGARPMERYRHNFQSIRTLGLYIEDLAREHNVPVIYSYQLDRTIADVIELVVAQATAIDLVAETEKQMEQRGADAS
jgi:2-phosphoglycerate kinase